MAAPPSKIWFNPALTPAQRVNAIGEVVYQRIYPIWIKEKDGLPSIVTAGRITGMILDLPLKEVDALLENETELLKMYETCKGVLLEHEKSKGAAK